MPVQQLVVNDEIHGQQRHARLIEGRAHHYRVVEQVVVTELAEAETAAPGQCGARHGACEVSLVDLVETFAEIMKAAPGKIHFAAEPGE